MGRSVAKVPASGNGLQFDTGWLALREPLDAAARDKPLTTAAARWLAPRPGPHELVDLGSGTGSNARYLAPHLPGPQRWRLVDQDRRLLSRAEGALAGLRDGDGHPLGLTLVCRSISPVDGSLLDGARMVVASALLDLVSADWLEALVAACMARRQALLITLSVDGEWWFVDAAGAAVHDEADRLVRELFQADQGRDKGMGAALGGAAPARLVKALRGSGYRVRTAATPWQIPAGDRRHHHLVQALLAGWRDAALTRADDRAGVVHEWYDRRLADWLDGRLGIRVGHRDVLATPARGGGP